MKNISKTLCMIFGFSLLLSSAGFSDDTKTDAVAAAIDRNTKAVEENTKAVKEAGATSSTVKTVAESGYKAGIAWMIFKIGDGILKAATAVKGGAPMIIIIPTSVLKQMTHPGGSETEAMMINDEPLHKYLDSVNTENAAPKSRDSESKSVAI